MLKDKKDAIVGCNGSGFNLEKNWEPAENSILRLTKTPWNMRSAGNLVLTDGKVMRALKNTNGVELKTSGEIGILPNGSLKLYAGTTYDKVINDGVKNTFKFTSYPLIVDGKVYSNIQDTDEYPRTCVGQIDANNFIILQCDNYTHHSSLKGMAKIGQKLNCKSLYNFDGGGSTTLWIRKLEYWHGGFHESARPVADALYFTTTQKYSKANGTGYDEWGSDYQEDAFDAYTKWADFSMEKYYSD